VTLTALASRLRPLAISDRALCEKMISLAAMCKSYAARREAAGGGKL
jgi:hypothetical protein